MIKKGIFSVLTVVLTINMVSAQEYAQAKDVKGIHPINVSENVDTISARLAHFSIGLEGGFNAFDGDFASEMKHPVWAPMAGLTFEYHLTPMWTLGAGYVFDWYRVTGKGGEQHADVLLNGRMHRIYADLGFDLMAACFPQWEQRIFAWDFFVGGGYGWFKNSIYYPDDFRQHTADATPYSNDKFKSSGFLLAGTEFSFNINRTFAIGIRGWYSYFVRDDVDGRGVGSIERYPSTRVLNTSVASKNNDGIFDVSAHLRIKLAAVKKTHERNGSISQMPYNRYKPDTRKKDTVEIYHTDTIMIVRRDTVIQDPLVTAALQSLLENGEYYSIYFDNDKSSFTNDALIRIQQVANRLQMDPSLCAEVVGMCDNTGSVYHNDTLGWSRAHNVYDELVNEYLISADRLTYYGRGIVYGGRSKGSYQPNRRCDVRLIPCDRFDDVKLEAEEKQQQASEMLKGGSKAAKKAEAEARKAEAEAKRAEAAQKKSDAARRSSLPAPAVSGKDSVVVVEDGMTLSTLAIKYYSNAYCWVFIYEANKADIPNPNYIQGGSQLTIPALTLEQLDVNREDSEDYFQSIYHPED